MMKQLFVLSLMAGGVYAKDFGTRSAVYPIAEEDAAQFFQKTFAEAAKKYLAEVEQGIDTPVPVPGITPASEERDVEVSLPEPLPFPLLFLNGNDPKEIAWAKEQEGLWILVDGSPAALAEQEEREVYFDQGGFYTATLGVQHTPAIALSVEGKTFVKEIPCSR